MSVRSSEIEMADAKDKEIAESAHIKLKGTGSTNERGSIELVRGHP